MKKSDIQYARAFKHYPESEDKELNDRNYMRRAAYLKALEDNEDFKYTEKELVEAFYLGYDRGAELSKFAPHNSDELLKIFRDREG